MVIIINIVSLFKIFFYLLLLIICSSRRTWTNIYE